MSIDGLLTFVGLIVALLALATDARRSALMLRPGATLLATVIFGLAVLYLELFDVVAPTCAWRVEVCQVLVLGEDRRIAPQDAAFVLVLVWLGLILLNLKRTALKPRHMSRLLRLATDLADEKRFSELCRVTQPHLGLIADTAGGAGKASEAQREAATTLQRLLYRRPELIRFIALERPVMATRMLAVESQVVFDFADRLLTILIANTDSPLFSEVSENRNIFDTGYVFPDHNTYLSFLFGDARNANRLAAWRPVMEHTLTHLGDARGQPYQTFLNSPADRFEETCWRDPTFVAIRYLDLMVDAAMRQGIEWHMWLFYAPHLTRMLLELYDDPRRDDEDVIAEWPTRNAYLLYALFDAMTDWIQAVNDLPEGSPHLMLESTRATHQNGNIPKSAIIALGDCLRQVLKSDEVSDRFKGTLVDLVFSALDRLPKTGPRAGFRESFVASLIAGGPLLMTDHLPRLYSAFCDLDHILRGRLSDAEAAVEAALKLWPPGRPAVRAAHGGSSGAEPESAQPGADESAGVRRPDRE